MSTKGNSEESRKRLQKAALEVFSERGFKGATTREIAQRAGLNLALIARYFGSKEGLFDSVIGAYAGEIVGDLEYPPRDSLEEELRDFLQTHLERFGRDIRFIRVTMAEALVDAERCEKLRRHFPREGGHPMLLRRLEQLRSQGRIATGTDIQAISEGVTTYLVGQLFGGMLIMGMSTQELAREVERFLKYFVAGR